jgi:hypothetical protein
MIDQRLKPGGKKNLENLDAKLRDDPKGGKGFQDYDQKIASDYYAPDLDAKAISVHIDATGKKWFAENGIKLGKDVLTPGPKVKPVEIYGFPAKDRGETPSIWSGQVNGADSVMIRNRQYTKGAETTPLYKETNERARLFASDHLAKTWENYGVGQPLKKLGVEKIENLDAKPLVQDIFRRKGTNPVEIGPEDEAWIPLMGSSVGGPLIRALSDHPKLFHQHKPTKMSLYNEEGGTGNTFYAIISLDKGVP